MLGKYYFIHQSAVARSGEFGKKKICFEAESDGNVVMAPGQCMKKRSSWGGGTLNRPREELAEAGRGSCPCVCVRVCLIEDICFSRKAVFGTTLT